MGRNWLGGRARRELSRVLVLPLLALLLQMFPILFSWLMAARLRTKGRNWLEPIWPRGKRLAMTMMNTDRMQIKEMSEMQTGEGNKMSRLLGYWKTVLSVQIICV